MTEYPDTGIAVCTSDRHRGGIVAMPVLDVEPAMRRKLDRRGA